MADYWLEATIDGLVDLTPRSKHYGDCLPANMLKALPYT
jgi:hypothetical protein